jgi:hypothetical protein
MSKVLLIGYNPPQFMGDAKIEAAHYRTWQFLTPLIDDGHQIHLCAGVRGEPIPTGFDMPKAWQDQVTYDPILFGESGWQKQMQAAHDTFQPDCVVAVNFSHCLYASRLQTDRPIWMDIYGDMVTIMQASNFRSQSDRGMGTTLGFLRNILQTGDAFSGCGEPQKHITVGELAMSGRLNHRTFGFEFAHVVLPGSPPMDGRIDVGRNGRNWLSQFGVGQDDFVVLWCGGYNTWTDVDTLFTALETSMAADKRVHYVSVGASTYGSPDNVYEQLLTKIEHSSHKENYHMLGWRPWSEIMDFYRESDVGLNIDALHYETIYGTRTRLVEMIAAGLPVVTSLGSELSYLLRDADVALAFEVGDAQGLSKQILTLSRNEEKRCDMANGAYRYAANDLSFYETTAPLRKWVSDPQNAPDKQTEQTFKDRMQKLEYSARAFLRQLLWQISYSDE